MEKDSGTVFKEVKKDVSTWVDLKLELLKLSTYERTGQVVSVLSYGLILLFASFFAILFIFLALGVFLGDWFDSMWAGFGVVALLYLLLTLLIVINKERIRLFITNIIIAALTANDEKHDTTTNEQQATDATGEAAR
ncbi:MAG: phage holin family protein [Parabacteroides sp.]